MLIIIKGMSFNVAGDCLDFAVCLLCLDGRLDRSGKVSI